jgi:DNA modification methylase
MDGRMIECIDSVEGKNFQAFNGDCVEVMAQLPENSVDFSVYSPPFANLYIYSESVRDMGNVENDEEFQAAYSHAVREKFRVTKPGRLTSIHVKDLVYYSNASSKGDRGIRDFTGACIRTHIEAGWTMHSRVTIWRCPVREMTKSKPDGLLYKNFRKDAGRIRQGMPEYIVTFRKWGDTMSETPPIVHVPGLIDEWAGEGQQFVGAGHTEDYYRALDIWQQWASPVWMNTNEKDVLNVRIARDEDAERHLCPMPLDLSERCIRLWSNTGDVVLSPFMGVGSEGWSAIKADRKFIGVELNPTYFAQAGKMLREAESTLSSGDLLQFAAR